MSKWWNDTTDVILLKNPREPSVIKQLVASHFFVNRKILWPQKQRMPEGLPHLLALSIDGSAETINLTRTRLIERWETKPLAMFFKTTNPETAKNWGRVPQHYGKYVREKGPLSPTNLWTNSKVWRLWRFGFGVWFHGFCFLSVRLRLSFFKGCTRIWFEIEKVQKRKKIHLHQKGRKLGKVSKKSLPVVESFWLIYWEDSQR